LLHVGCVMSVVVGAGNWGLYFVFWKLKNPNWPFMMPKSQERLQKGYSKKVKESHSLRCLPLLSLLCLVQGGTQLP
jgi:hypothetical protein